MSNFHVDLLITILCFRSRDRVASIREWVVYVFLCCASACIRLLYRMAPQIRRQMAHDTRVRTMHHSYLFPPVLRTLLVFRCVCTFYFTPSHEFSHSSSGYLSLACSLPQGINASSATNSRIDTQTTCESGSLHCAVFARQPHFIVFVNVTDIIHTKGHHNISGERVIACERR